MNKFLNKNAKFEQEKAIPVLGYLVDGLKIAWDMGFGKVLVETYNAAMVCVLNTERVDRRPFNL